MNNQLLAVELNRLTKGWVETASADNAVATASRAGETGKTFIITGVSASYSASTTGLLQIKDGINVIFERYVYDSDGIPLNVKATEGNTVSAELSASGAAGVIGKVNLTGYTV
jgi:hypothetical protein